MAPPTSVERSGLNSRTYSWTLPGADILDSRAILLLDGESSYALNVARCLTSVRGVRVHALATRRNIPLKFSRTIASFRTWAGFDQPDAAQTCASMAREVRADVCLAVGETAVSFLAREQRRLPVPCAPVPAVPALQAAIDKWQLACYLRRESLPHPDTVLTAPDEATRATLTALPFPVLIKPRVGGNGVGIRRFDTADALLRHLDYFPDSWNTTIVQPLIRGIDVDCSVLCADGQVLAYTIQRGFTPASNFRSPGGVEFIHDAQVIALVRRVAAALQWTGVAHVDLRYDWDRGDLKIIEINPRFWGSVLASLHAGANFPYLACEYALGHALPAQSFRPCRYVAGGTALGYWKRGKIGVTSAGFTPSDTVFRYALRDPLPMLMEPLLKRR